ncbi:hypothetical protein SARC_04155 [Sphaeroforma arctica JP610]|uniref:Uncharacterized protein n=1 Tax=Sphaeroforma arctica JP610 TaxID=667725 RepID=A0A0L0G466_9EUKA|nr:hypothetical protein SARC_04155 [Sphaeroforma arctica JP610]KNC83596.1 hypothetical protein SARC_04155 [Sphaeroforma arctica JP610]|eukprot:XP_014157498.1 hypothetical protein SARC_04155 [Sphaeroforma arctica JP610]
MDTMSMRSDVSGLSRASSIAGKMDDKMDEAKHMISRMSRAIRSTRPSKFEYTKESKQKSRGSMSRASRRNSVRDEAALETSSELLWERAVEQSIAHRRGCGGNEDANTTTSSPDIVSQPKGARPLTVGTLPEAEWFCGQGSETIDMLGKGQAPRTPETGLCKSRSIRYVQQTRPATNESGAVQTQTKFVSRPGSQVEGSVDSRRVMTFPSWAQTEVDQQTADTLMIDQDQSLELTLEMQNFLFPETAAMERPIVKIIHANDLRELDVKLRNLVQKGGTTPKAHGGHMAPLNRIQNLRVPKKLAGGGVFDENKRLRSLSSPSPFTQEEPDEEISTSPATDSIANYKEVTDIINAANILDLSDSEPTPKVADGSIQRSTVKRGPKARPRPSHLQDDLRSASNGSMNSTSAMSDHVARSHSSASGAPVPNRPPPPKKLPAFVKAQQQEIESPTMLTKHEGIQSPDVQQRRPTRPANPPKRQITMRN